MVVNRLLPAKMCCVCSNIIKMFRALYFKDNYFKSNMLYIYWKRFSCMNHDNMFVCILFDFFALRAWSKQYTFATEEITIISNAIEEYSVSISCTVDSKDRYSVILLFLASIPPHYHYHHPSFLIFLSLSSSPFCLAPLLSSIFKYNSHRNSSDAWCPI